MIQNHNFFIFFLVDEDDQNISDDDENVQVNSNRKFDKGGLNGLSTVYKIGSKPDLRSGSDYKVVDDFSTVQPEKPNLIFGKSESVIDDEGKQIDVNYMHISGIEYWGLIIVIRNGFYLDQKNAKVSFLGTTKLKVSIYLARQNWKSDKIDKIEKPTKLKNY